MKNQRKNARKNLRVHFRGPNSNKRAKSIYNDCCDAERLQMQQQQQQEREREGSL